MLTSQHCNKSRNSTMPPRKRKRGYSKSAADTCAVGAVSGNDEEPERVEEPLDTQGSDVHETRMTDNDPPTGAFKEKRPPLRLHLDQEQVVFEFVESHQELYSKGHPDFMKTGQKQALWQQLADTLNATDFDGSIANGHRIMTWWNSQRSAYGKVTRNVSGQGAKRLTAREERLKEGLAFLSAHVYRVPKRAGVDLMGQLREKHPERFNAPAAQDRPPRESDTDSEQTTPTVTQTDEHIRTSNQTTMKRKPSHLLLEKIEKRMDANQQQMSQLIKQEDNPRAAFGRLVGLSAAQMDDEAFEGLQMAVTNLLVKYKRESRARTQVALVTQAAPRSPPRPQVQPGATTHHTVGDLFLTSGIAAQQNQQCPGGFIPDWQRQYQQQPDTQQADQPQRSSSAPMDFYSV